jgi:hypothetical protein
MVDLLSLPDEILTDILDIGGHTTIVVCQQARILIDNSRMDIN